jgi:hypothetical protein
VHGGQGEEVREEQGGEGETKRRRTKEEGRTREDTLEIGHITGFGSLYQSHHIVKDLSRKAIIFLANLALGEPGGPDRGRIA